MTDIKYNYTYKYDLSQEGNGVSLGAMSHDVVYSLFKDGRTASRILEQYLPMWFDDLTFVDQKGYDHVDKRGNKYDLKGFTVRGANFRPSSMLGAGRTFDVEEFQNHAKSIDYVFSDIAEFPKVNIVFKKGADLLEKFPTGKIKRSDQKELFKDNNDE